MRKLSPGMWLWLVLLLVPAAYAASGARATHTVDSHRWTDEYDRYFRKYTKRYFGPGKDWRWFKAQAIAESALRPDVKSHVGAVGLMQIMPTTFEEIRRSNPHFRAIDDPRWNIAAGIWYDRRLYRHWTDDLPNLDDRLAYTFASYNAGLGGVLKAYKRSGTNKVEKNERSWDRIRPYTPRETRGYVSRIRELMGDG
ncbi:MAG: transglycosylase SLT domain-containing protein [Gammaproteobacteria bacterium]